MMPRQTAGRETANEANVAERVAMERERRGWSYETLAKRMGDAGCVIQSSALFKIEKAGRRITVEELVALARVFDTTLDDLLTPLEELRDKRIRQAMKNYRAASKGIGTALAEYLAGFADLVEVSGMPGAHEFFVAQLGHANDDAVSQALLKLADHPAWNIDAVQEGAIREAVSALLATLRALDENRMLKTIYREQS